MHFSTKLLNQLNLYENNYSILHYKADFVEILQEFGRPHFPTVKSALQAWKDAKNAENKVDPETVSRLEATIAEQQKILQ